MDDQGWGRPASATKFHYFVNGRAFCNRWLYYGDLEDGLDDDSLNCAACRKKVVAYRAKQGAGTDGA